jgi:hypothetical protein
MRGSAFVPRLPRAAPPRELLARHDIAAWTRTLAYRARAWHRNVVLHCSIACAELAVSVGHVDPAHQLSARHRAPPIERAAHGFVDAFSIRCASAAV